MATDETEQPGAAERPRESGAAAPGRGGRMSRRREASAVLRLLRGEDLERVSRSLGVTAATLSERLARRVPRRGRGGADGPSRERRSAGRGAAEGQAGRGDGRARPAACEARPPGVREPFGPPQAEAMSRV